MLITCELVLGVRWNSLDLDDEGLGFEFFLYRLNHL